jgi:hypothetical protein
VVLGTWGLLFKIGTTVMIPRRKVRDVEHVIIDRECPSKYSILQYE